MKKLLFLLPLLFTLAGCSWQEYFAVFNSTGSPADITYELDTNSKGFPIFETQPTCYKLTSNSNIDWDKPVNIEIQHPEATMVKMRVPAGCVLIIGNLSNDTYKKHDQKFINDRHFNLKELRVTWNNHTKIIVPKNFDSHFTKTNGVIRLWVK